MSPTTTDAAETNDDPAWGPPQSPPLSAPLSPPLSAPPAAASNDGITRSAPRADRRVRRLWRRIGWTRLITGVAAIAAFAAGFLLVWSGDDAPVALPAAPQIVTIELPNTMEPKFEIDADAIVGSFGQITAVIDDATIVQYDGNGGERWTRALPDGVRGATLHPQVQGVFPIEFETEDSAREWQIGFVDGSTGQFTDAAIRVERTPDAVIREVSDHLYLWSQTTAALYDPATGEQQATVEGRYVDVDDSTGAVYVWTDTGLSVYDPDLSPILTDLQIAGRVSWVDVPARQIVTVDGNRLVGYDKNGEKWSAETGLDDLDLARPVGVDRWALRSVDGDLAIISTTNGDDNGGDDNGGDDNGGDDNGGDDNGGEYGEVWRTSDIRYFESAGDDRLVLVGDDRTTLIDSDGNTLYETNTTDAADRRILGNGILFGRTGDDGSTISFVDLSGKEQWTIETSVGPAALSIIDDAIFDSRTNTVYGPAPSTVSTTIE